MVCRATSDFAEMIRKYIVFMIGKISPIQGLHVLCCYLWFSDKGSSTVLYGFLRREVDYSRQVLTSLDFMKSAKELLILRTSVDEPWFTIPYWVIYHECQKSLHLGYHCLKWAYDLVIHWRNPVHIPISILNHRAHLFWWYIYLCNYIWTRVIYDIWNA